MRYGRTNQVKRTFSCFRIKDIKSRTGKEKKKNQISLFYQDRTNILTKKTEEIILKPTKRKMETVVAET